jgi:hypothetical protein
MPRNIRNEEVNRLAEQLAAIKHVTKTDAVMLALKQELRRALETVPLIERIKNFAGSYSRLPADR